MIFSTLQEEQSLWNSGFCRIAGIDEVGRGCFAGPLVVGAVIFASNAKIPDGIADSKLLRPKRREELAKKIKESALAWSVVEISVKALDKVGIGKATQIAFRQAVKSLAISPDFILIDAFYIKHLNRQKQKAIIKGDLKCTSIAAASIIAKVYRDKLMVKLHAKYPHYNFAQNKGYGTKLHRGAIKKYGLSRIHRKSFNII